MYYETMTAADYQVYAFCDEIPRDCKLRVHRSRVLAEGPLGHWKTMDAAESAFHLCNH